MLTLILAGEVVYMLPFGLTRFFRPSHAGGIRHYEHAAGRYIRRVRRHGDDSVLPGRRLGRSVFCTGLLTASLIATVRVACTWRHTRASVGLAVLFAYWGITTILLFWAALIRATREWGGDDEQGMAFGILEGGRGLVAALLASIGVVLLAIIHARQPVTAQQRERRGRISLGHLLLLGRDAGAAGTGMAVHPAIKHIGDRPVALFQCRSRCSVDLSSGHRRA